MTQQELLYGYLITVIKNLSQAKPKSIYLVFENNKYTYLWTAVYANDN